MAMGWGDRVGRNDPTGLEAGAFSDSDSLGAQYSAAYPVWCATDAWDPLWGTAFAQAHSTILVTDI